MIWGVDSATPSPNPAGLVALGYEFACGYLGPVGGTPHVWTANEWKRHRDAGLKLGPIWVAPYGAPGRQAGLDHGNAALTVMQLLHMSGFLFLDVENGAAPRDYAAGFVDAVHAGSCAVGLYGSRTTILGIGDLLGQGDAWWLADWLPDPGPAAPPDWSMWQCSSVWISGTRYDLNVARDDFPFAEME